MGLKTCIKEKGIWTGICKLPALLNRPCMFHFKYNCSPYCRSHRSGYSAILPMVHRLHDRPPPSGSFCSCRWCRDRVDQDKAWQWVHQWLGVWVSSQGSCNGPLHNTHQEHRTFYILKGGRCRSYICGKREFDYSFCSYMHNHYVRPCSATSIKHTWNSLEKLILTVHWFITWQYTGTFPWTDPRRYIWSHIHPPMSRPVCRWIPCRCKHLAKKNWFINKNSQSKTESFL